MPCSEMLSHIIVLKCGQPGRPANNPNGPRLDESRMRHDPIIVVLSDRPRASCKHTSCSLTPMVNIRRCMMRFVLWLSANGRADCGCRESRDDAIDWKRRRGWCLPVRPRVGTPPCHPKPLQQTVPGSPDKRPDNPRASSSIDC